MKSQVIQRYDHPAHFEPLMPSQAAIEPLLERASDLNRASLALGSSAVPAAQRELRLLLRAMNSYYTNRLEGEHTRPSEIDNALKKDFSNDQDLARKQRLAVSHIETESHCEAEIDKRIAAGDTEAWRWLYSVDAVKWLHTKLFDGLTDVDRQLMDGSNLVPGELRKRQVAVGRHEAPDWQSLDAFLERWAGYYGKVRRGEAAIVAACASHHRLAWVHPMEDGNGRTARLHTHLLFYAMQLSSGLWSPLRGFARAEERYRSLLAGADAHRQGDLDGRGNLSEKALVNWISFVLDICIDQVNFMVKQLDVTGMRSRIAASIQYDQEVEKLHVRPEVVNALHYLFTSGVEMPRADFKAMTTLGDRVATSTLSALLKLGYVATDSAYGNIRFAIPRHALRFYFPALWPEAEQDQSTLTMERLNQHAIIKSEVIIQPTQYIFPEKFEGTPGMKIQYIRGKRLDAYIETREHDEPNDT